MNRVVIGNPSIFEFDDTNIRSLTSSVSVDIVGAELSIDQICVVIDYQVGAYILFTPKDYDGVLTEDGYLFGTSEALPDIRQIQLGTPIYQYHNDELVAKFYFKSIDRIASGQYQINGVSAIGLLDAVQHMGGLYNGTQTFADVVGEIVGNTIPYTIEEDIENVPIFGWLPIDSARNNLHKLMFAEGVSLTKDQDGDIIFSYLYDAISATVPSSRVYMGGKVDYSTPATRAEITEHSYFALGTDEVVQLFDNTGEAAADHLLVTFDDAPIHTIEANGLPVSGAGVYGNLTIHEIGVNYAILSGNGDLSGQKYTHNTQIIRRDSSTPSTTENVVSVKDCCLISQNNSANVAKRVLAYYESRKRVGAMVILDGEKAGRQIEFSDPYGETEKGFIARMEITASINLKADCEIITGYEPTGQGNNYNSAVILTGSGTFEVPSENIKVVIGGGGQGGRSGSNGSNGGSGGGTGGAGGSAGQGGKCLVVELTGLTVGDTIAYSCGQGGASDADGGDTTFGSYSSANGSIQPNGFFNFFNGKIYGLSGEDGANGADAGSAIFHDGVMYSAGTNGAARYQSFTGVTSYGGTGGGAAVGSNGGNGADGDWEFVSGVGYQYYGGNGGAGANATIDGADAIDYCNGGSGGHGGGGGGGGGGTTASIGGHNGAAGIGGSGSLGGKGGDGCIIVYYS